MDLNELIESLNSLLTMIHEEKDEDTKFFAVIKFDDSIFCHEGVIINEEIEDILVDLATTLEDYMPFPEERRQVSDFFGDEQLEEEVKNALEKIKKIMKLEQ